MKKYISIITPCFNEEANVGIIVTRIRNVMKDTSYDYEHILIDNCSTDCTWEKIKEEAKHDTHIKGIKNARNFGALRSIAHAMFQGSGDAIIAMACDLQDPPELIPSFLDRWERGYKVILGKKTGSKESLVKYKIRGLYYAIISRFSDVPQFNQTTGFGLYDRSVIEQIKELDEPEPSLRHIIADLGYKVEFIEFEQPIRENGKSKFNIASYFDYALNTFINTSQAPLKLAVVWGFCISLISFVLGVFFLIWKLTDWMRFDTGQAPLLIGTFFIGGILLMFLGIIGEYVGEVLKRVTKRPLVIEQERIGFENIKKND